MLIQEALKQSDKIRRACWESKRFIDKDKHGRIFNGYGAFPLLTEEDLNADDWEVYREPLKIEVGKFYRTRGGLKAFVFCKNEDDLYPFNFCILGFDSPDTCNENGYCVFGQTVQVDLVAEWEASDD